MFQHVLLPVDLSDRNEQAVRTAFDIATTSNARVTLLHVIPRVSGIPFAELESLYAQLETKARNRLAATIRKNAPPGLDARAVVAIGDPARDVVRFAERHLVGLIVIGSHPVDPKSGKLGWGTTSYKVALLCACPVLLVKSAPRRRAKAARS
jgi:nucleotide-binding universal stress UspA family protein